MNDPRHAPRLAGGFLDRGANVTRIEAFVDAAFAFAVTLLVISLNSVPTSMPGLLQALKGVPAFAASFAQIMMFWSAHAAWSRRYGLDDAASQRLSLVLVFLVLVYVYPLKILFGNFFGWVSGGWLPAAAEIHSLGELRTMFVLYGIAFGTMSVCLAALYRHAWQCADALGLDREERRRTRGEMVRWVYWVTVAMTSITTAVLLPSGTPGWLLAAPGMLYGLLSFSGWVIERAAESMDSTP